MSTATLRAPLALSEADLDHARRVAAEAPPWSDALFRRITALLRLAVRP